MQKKAAELERLNGVYMNLLRNSGVEVSGVGAATVEWGQGGSTRVRGCCGAALVGHSAGPSLVPLLSCSAPPPPRLPRSTSRGAARCWTRTPWTWGAAASPRATSSSPRGRAHLSPSLRGQSCVRSPTTRSRCQRCPAAWPSSAAATLPVRRGPACMLGCALAHPVGAVAAHLRSVLPPPPPITLPPLHPSTLPSRVCWHLQGPGRRGAPGVPPGPPAARL